MFSRFPNIFLCGLFLALVSAGAYQGSRVEHLRESEAFYRWILAAATNERLFQDTDEEYRDAAIFQAVQADAPQALPETAERSLVELAADDAYDDVVWQLASSQRHHLCRCPGKRGQPLQPFLWLP